MTKRDRFLIWHYKHHRLFDTVWGSLGWLLLPAVAIIGNSTRWFTVLLLFWYALFGLLPIGFASVLANKLTEEIGLVEPDT